MSPARPFSFTTIWRINGVIDHGGRLEQRRTSGGKARLAGCFGLTFRGVQKTLVFCTVTSVGVQNTDVFCTPPEPRVNWAFPPLLLCCSSGRACLFRFGAVG